jgi:DNA polymerase-3 subunit gamma/tau
MLAVVDELERNGHNLQHFCRELSRYFRNLVVAKIAGASTRLIAASPAERERLTAIAASFSQEDLTRYLQIALDLYGDLQRSLQPRLHMEIGLLRMVQAGRLMAIEEALSMIGEGGSQPPQPPPPARRSEPPRAGTASRTTQPPPAPTTAKPANPASGDTGWKQKLHAAFIELGMPFTADAIEHSDVMEVAGELQFLTPKDFRLSMKEPDLRRALAHLGFASMRLKVTFGEPVAPTPVAPQETVAGDENELTRRALAHPEVQRFRATFGGQVRAVRNLKE